MAKTPKSMGKRKIKRPVITFTSGTLLNLTRHAAERSRAREHASESMVAIILAATAIEAYLHESIEYAQMIVKEGPEKDEVETVASIVNDFEKKRASTVVKVEIAHFIFTGKRLDRSETQFQHYALLRSIRNHLVHKKPEVIETTATEDTEPHKLVKALAELGVIELPPQGFAPLWEQYVCVPQVAAWAHDVAVDMVRFIGNLYPNGIRGPAGVLLQVQSQIKQKLFNPPGGEEIS